MNVVCFGCSYTNGTNREELRDRTTWPFKLGYSCNVSVVAASARSNRSIINSINEKIQEGLVNKDTIVIVHWSHSERQALAVINKMDVPFYLEDYKNLAPDGLVIGQNDFSRTELWAGLLTNGLNEIYLVQELLKNKCKDYFFITTDHYQSYKWTRSEVINLINKDKIFNWPSEFENIFDIASGEGFICNWITQSLPLTIGRYLGEEYIYEDFKHLNSKGHAEFGNMLAAWIENPSKDWNYILSNSSSRQQQVCKDSRKGFEELQRLYKKFPKSVHWVENTLEKVNIKTQQVDYVYEN